MTRVTIYGPIRDLPDGPEVWVEVLTDKFIDLPSALSLVTSPEELALLSECPLPAVAYTETREDSGYRYGMTWALAYAGKQDV
ncbi:hypothetical protein [Nocardioides massiliensis]|uniref:Uncharacterized protein n=1 Tax=Nocardioides massiliensis TaxID=1325935 RepID=A0ABT9NJA1_9ACTN|nr:hypothetical protein [Nocardioides massiliensis]MDP9820496.1 hypothetical protein [Nocardioides massiliensis]